MSVLRRKKAGLTEFERRSLPGVPDAFTGRDTTLGTQRRMARQIRDEAWQTPTERGLAISLLAVLDLFEKEAPGGEAE